jgi:hypothetical protein
MSCSLVPNPWMVGGAAAAVAAVKIPAVAIPATPIAVFIVVEVNFTLNSSRSVTFVPFVRAARSQYSQ